MSDSKPALTPIIKENSEDTSLDESKFPYRQAVGAQSYLMVGTRPDISYAVSVASRNLEKPTKRDVIGVKRILRYLKGSVDKGLTFKTDITGNLNCYSDADFSDDQETCHSTTGIICLYSGYKLEKSTTRNSSLVFDRG
ncbi:uncharacterized protein LOC131843028 [Achroia grisella]|uniref:uncharacterized protein LOC131843028 n=1 Tax=Achroia grisella TaxID=688607 RepID=UPI0027D28240|nr:uncharacterized protein LOC131843028 [Achroia grisella]